MKYNKKNHSSLSKDKIHIHFKNGLFNSLETVLVFFNYRVPIKNRHNLLQQRLCTKVKIVRNEKYRNRSIQKTKEVHYKECSKCPPSIPTHARKRGIQVAQANSVEF